MSKQKLHSVLEALMNNDNETATKFLRETLDEKGNNKLTDSKEDEEIKSEVNK